METQLSDHKSNHSIGLLVHENLSIEPNIKSVARILTEAGMAISRILVRGGGHLGFTKMPPD